MNPRQALEHELADAQHLDEDDITDIKEAVCLAAASGYLSTGGAAQALTTDLMDSFRLINQQGRR